MKLFVIKEATLELVYFILQVLLSADLLGGFSYARLFLTKLVCEMNGHEPTFDLPADGLRYLCACAARRWSKNASFSFLNGLFCFFKDKLRAREFFEICSNFGDMLLYYLI